MNAVILNRTQLVTEINRLEALKHEQELVLKSQLNSPANIFASVVQLFKGSGGESHKFSEVFKTKDFYGVAAKFLMPLLLNKTLFRKSNFIVKAVVALVSQRAGGALNQNIVQNISHKIGNLFGRFKKEKGLVHTEDYGIPPGSETY